MKELLRHLGKVIEFNNPPKLSIVLLTEVATGKVYETNVVSEKLVAANVGQNDEFEIIISQDDHGKTTGVIKKIEPPFNNDGSAI